MFFDHGLDCNQELHKVKDNENMYTPMHYSALFGALNVLLGLISRGAGVDPPDTLGKTPLIIALEQQKVAVVRSLIELGADLEVRDNFQRTPMMYACKSGNKEVVELMLKYKADINATNKVGDTCVSMAQKSGNASELMMLLVQSGASLRPGSKVEGRKKIEKIPEESKA